MSSQPRPLPRIANLVRQAVVEGGGNRALASASFGGRRRFEKPTLSASDVNSIMLALKDLDSAELGVNGRSSISTSVGDPESTDGLPIGFCFVGGEADVFEASIFVLPPNARIPGTSHCYPSVQSPHSDRLE